MRGIHFTLLHTAGKVRKLCLVWYRCQLVNCFKKSQKKFCKSPPLPPLQKILHILMHLKLRYIKTHKCADRRLLKEVAEIKQTTW
ncbi:hypothetical protein GDO81_029698 [Engystomops pustulosus]|uniref:Secreted protein n=1 Tax=Engystomops pustulosus TaxID=76066 RepID=A0AAV6YIG6_ENGPU|nr:hypothetical protein GDO81_029698 [Engystomops pustulosus]